MALENAQFYLQLTYCETTFCHRFVHFEVDSDYIEQFEPILNEYIDSLKTQENDAILHYHLQEMPSKRQLAQMDPSSNALVGKGKKKSKKSIQVKDLFGGNLEGDDDEDEIDLMDQDDSFNMAEGFFDGAAGTQEKSYTLTMICDPEDSGLEKKFSEYRKYMIEKDGFANKPRRLIINGNQ